MKAKAAYAFCDNVNAVMKDKKVWRYMLIVDGEISRNTTFDYLVNELKVYSYHK